MDEIKKAIAKNYPLWVAQKQSQPQPSLQQRQVNGRLQNAAQMTDEEVRRTAQLQAIMDITTAQA
jgi:hypothetical protein